MPQFSWELTTRGGILVDEAADAWWSGHVTDILELEGRGSLLVATETGGVWIVPESGPALSCSDQWENPDVNCLARGPDGEDHFFAGCDAGVIYETDVGAKVPLLAWKPSATLPAGAGNVNGLAVIPRRRILIAAADGGLYWSRIPAAQQKAGCLGAMTPPGLRPPRWYVWQRAAEPAVAGNGYFGVALGATGPRRSSKVGLEDLGSMSVVAGGKQAGVFIGTWADPKTLTLERARYVDEQGRDLTEWWFHSTGPTSVTSCESFPETLYAACSYPDGLFKMVIRSADGGRHWTKTGSKVVKHPQVKDLAGVAGENGFWNNCIAVMPDGPGVVALGWQAAGPIISPNAGGEWIVPGPSSHLHKDVHALRFRRDDTAGEVPEVRLLVGSDGGLAEVNMNDLMAFKTTARSDMNRQLPTLQCYANNAARQFYGSLGASALGHIATGVQDNGNLFLDGDSRFPWRWVDGGDGGWNGFIEDRLLARNVMGNPVATVEIGPSGPDPATSAVVPMEYPAPADPSAGLPGPVADVVRSPSFRDAAGTVVAVAGEFNARRVFGLFVDRSSGSQGWYLLGRVPRGLVVSAVASHRGDLVHISAGGRFFLLDVASGSTKELTRLLPKPYPKGTQTGGVAHRICTVSSTEAFALLDGTSLGMHYVLRFRGGFWHLPASSGLPRDQLFYGLDGGHREGAPFVFATTDDSVYFSADAGESWSVETSGLPRRPHCAEVRVAKSPREQTSAMVYLSTFGRSVFHTSLGGVEWRD